MIRTRGAIHRALQESRKMLPEHVLALYRAGDAFGQQVAEYYCAQRNVPSANCLAISTSWVETAGYISTYSQDIEILTAVCAVLDAVTTTKCILLCGAWPTVCSSQLATNNKIVNPINVISWPSALRHPYASLHGMWNEEEFTGSLGTTFAYGIKLPVLHEFGDEYQVEYNTPYCGGSFFGYESYQSVKNLADVAVARQNNTEYTLGQWVYSTTNTYRDGFRRFALECTTAGQTGPTDVFPTSSSDGVVHTDGTAQFTSHYTHEGPDMIGPINMPTAFRLPDDHRARVESYGDNPYGGTPRATWKDRLAYSVVYLDAPLVEPGDVHNSSRFAIIERMVTGAIAIEDAGYTKLFGKVFLDGSSAYPSASPVYLELQNYGQDLTDVYYQNLNVENFVGIYTPTLPTTKHADGCTYGYPRGSYSWTQQTDTFLIGQSASQYGGESNTGEHFHWHTRDHFTFKGGIVIAGHSCGANLPVYLAIDPHNTDRTLESTLNPVDKNALNTWTSLVYRVQYNRSEVAIMVKYTGAGTTAHVRVISNDVLVFYVDGASVGSAPLSIAPDRTLKGHLDYIVANLPAGWLAIPAHCTTANSRVASALRNGALVAAGAPYEPYTGSAANCTNLINTFAEGGCIGEWALSNVTYGIRYSIEPQPAEISMLIYADPLYRPFPRGFQ